MFKGIAFTLGACLIWSLIFVVPQFMHGFNSIEVALGRYLCFGLLSLLLFIKVRGEKRYPLAIWGKAFLYSFIFAVGYYPCLVMGLRHATPAISALIMGIGPITIALYGNWKEKECSFKSLILPSVLILIGLLFINGPALLGNETPTHYLIGLGACFCALATWTWYVVANARFLKDHREISSSQWSTLNGVTTLIWVILFVAGTLLFSDQFDRNKYFASSPQLTSFWIGSAILGVVCSWLGIFLWNKATLHLPVSFAGQLTILETVFGLILIYCLEQRMPPLSESIGIVLFLSAIIYGIRKSAETHAAL